MYQPITIKTKVDAVIYDATKENIGVLTMTIDMNQRNPKPTFATNLTTEQRLNIVTELLKQEVSGQLNRSIENPLIEPVRKKRAYKKRGRKPLASKRIEKSGGTQDTQNIQNETEQQQSKKGRGGRKAKAISFRKARVKKSSVAEKEAKIDGRKLRWIKFHAEQAAKEKLRKRLSLRRAKARKKALLEAKQAKASTQVAKE